MVIKSSKKEKRKFARIELEFPVSFVRFDQEKDEKGIACDISLEGLGVYTKKEFSKGTPVALKLNIPDGGKPILVKGEVRWAKPVGGGNYRLGITVTNLCLSSLERAFKIKLE